MPQDLQACQSALCHQFQSVVTKVKRNVLYLGVDIHVQQTHALFQLWRTRVYSLQPEPSKCKKMGNRKDLGSSSHTSFVLLPVIKWRVRSCFQCYLTCTVIFLKDKKWIQNKKTFRTRFGRTSFFRGPAKVRLQPLCHQQIPPLQITEDMDYKRDRDGKTLARERRKTEDHLAARPGFRALPALWSDMASKFASTVKCFNTTQNIEAAMLLLPGHGKMQQDTVLQI